MIQVKTYGIWYHSYMESRNNNKLVNRTQRNILTDIENKLLATSGEKERGQDNRGVGH